MKLKVISASIVAFTAALLLSGVALAGGWAVVPLDKVPTAVVAGEEVGIGFRVLQHGHNPLAGLDPQITATHRESGERLSFRASDSGTPGHYTASITLPRTGTWDWAIETFGGSHAMYPLEVRSGVPAQANLAGQVGLAEPVPASPQARYGPEREAEVSSRFWNWLAIGSGVAAIIALLAATGIITRVLPVPAMRSSS